MTNKPINEMTDQEIDNAMAEMMGWHKRLESDAWWGLCVSSNLGVSQETVWLNSENAGMWKCDYWHPHDDLNQVWQCEEKLLETTTERIYEDCLNFVLTMEFGYGKYSAVHAPARQRCIAMLMTVRENE